MGRGSVLLCFTGHGSHGRFLSREGAGSEGVSKLLLWEPWCCGRRPHSGWLLGPNTLSMYPTPHILPMGRFSRAPTSSLC